MRPLTSSYQSAVERLYELGHELAAPRKFDLAQVRVLLKGLGNPERACPGVLIAGTNGKGSTAATLASILIAAGYRTGLYTSPHLVCINERIRIEGHEIRDSEFANLYEQVECVASRLLRECELPWHPSFFEMLTAMAFTHFAHARVELAVLEVGMGGRLDATNVIEPAVSVITDISLDHQKFLGETIAEIAREKAGIIHPGGIVVTLPQHPEANQIIAERVLNLGARAVSAAQYVPPVSSEALRDRDSAELRSERTRGFAAEPGATAACLEQQPRNRYSLELRGAPIVVDSPLIGRHQLRNIALAIAAAEQLNRQGFKIAPHDIEVGIRKTRWPGRFQVIPPVDGRPEVVLDVAHNPAGAWALRALLRERYPDRPLTFVFGVMRDKAVAEVAAILFPLAERVIVTHASTPRSATVEEIRAIAGGICTNIIGENSVPAAVERARSLAEAAGVIVITGSIYVVGEAVSALGSGGVQALR